MSLEALLDQSISVERKSPTKDTSGAQVPNYQPVPLLQSLPAAIQQDSGKAVRTLGQRQVFVTHSVYVDQDYDIRRGDRISNDATGDVYVVHGVIDQAGKGVLWKIECTLQTA